MGRDEGRTVVRPRAAANPEGDVFARLAAPMLALAAGAVRDPRADAAALAAQAGQRAGVFATEALRAGVTRAEAAGARDALVAVFEARVRANPAVGATAWHRARRRHLAGVPALDAAALAGRLAAAEAGGSRELARFLRHQLDQKSEHWRSLRDAPGFVIGVTGALPSEPQVDCYAVHR